MHRLVLKFFKSLEVQVLIRAIVLSGLENMCTEMESLRPFDLVVSFTSLRIGAWVFHKRLEVFFINVYIRELFENFTEERPWNFFRLQSLNVP